MLGPVTNEATPHLLRDRRGAAYVEYLALLTLVTVIGSAATAALGLPLLRLFRYAETLIVLPFP
jgi:Flp pilus assembly pilin Flp